MVAVSARASDGGPLAATPVDMVPSPLTVQPSTATSGTTSIACSSNGNTCSTLGIAESLTATFFGPSWAPAVAFGILLITLAVRPSGILGR